MAHGSSDGTTIRVCLLFAALSLASALSVRAVSVSVPGDCVPAGACECNGAGTLCWPNLQLDTVAIVGANVTFDCGHAGQHPEEYPLGGAGTRPSGPIVEITANGVSLQNCIVQHGDGRGVWAHAANDVTLLGNHVLDTLLEPVAMEGVGSATASTGVILRSNVIEKARNTAQGTADRAVLLSNVTAGSELTCNVISSESNGVINNSNSGLASRCNAFFIYGRKFISTSSSPIAELSNQGSGMHSDGDCVVAVGDAFHPHLPTRCLADATWVNFCDFDLGGSCLDTLGAYSPFNVPPLNFDRNGDSVVDAVDENADGKADLLDDDGDGIVDWRDSNNLGTSAGIADTDIFGLGSVGRFGNVTNTTVEHALVVGVQVGLWAAAQSFTNHGVSYHDNHVISVGSRPPSSSSGLNGDGVLVQSADGLQLENQTILATNFGIVTNDAAHPGYPLLISGNTVNGSPFWSSALAYGAIQLQNTIAMTALENRVLGNTVSKWKGYGIAVVGGAAGAGVSISGNELTDVGGSAFDFEEVSGSDPINLDVAHNTVTSLSQPAATEGFYLDFRSGLSSLSIHDNDVLSETVFHRGAVVNDNYSDFEVFHNVFRPGGTTPKQTEGTPGLRSITKIISSQGNNWKTHCDAASPAVWSDVPAGTLSLVDPNAYEGTATVELPWAPPLPFVPGCFGTHLIPDASQPADSSLAAGDAGTSVADCGDLNNDGVSDTCDGAAGAGGGAFALTAGDEPGAVLVYFGSMGAGERAQADIIFTGVGAHDRAGVSVAGNFDFNGDGRPDIVIGAEQVDRTTSPGSPTPTGNGKVYVIFFDPNDAVHYPNIADPLVPDTVSLSLVGQPGGIPGVVLTGAAFGDQAGFSVAGGGTSTPGGGTDIVIGAPGADPGIRADAGAAYVVFDSPTLSGDVSLTRISSGLPDQVPGKAYLGSNSGDNLGFSTAFGGPIVQGQSPNTGTVLIGAPGVDGKKGTIIAPPGDPDTTPIIVDAVGTTHSGFQIRGTQTGEQLGFAVADGGDALADGVPDLLIGAPTYDAAGQTDAGRVLQTTQVIPTGVYTADDVGSTLSGLIWTGEATGDQLGYAVAGVSDVTGDGVDDIVLGAPFVDSVVGGVTQVDAGAVYLIDGRPATGSLGAHSVAEVGTIIAGQELTGTQAGDHVGSSVAGTGDISGDGTNDFVVGAPGKDAGAGTVYMVLHLTPPPFGECGPSGCQVADLLTGAEVEVPTGGLAVTVSLTVQGILDASALPAPVPAGKMLFGAARFAPDGLSVLSPLAAIHIPTGRPLSFARAPNEVLPLFYYNGSGWVAAGINGTTGPNPSYPTQIAVNAAVAVLHVYAVFLNDTDGDGVRDETDNCPVTPNPSQADANHDGIGDACQCLNVNCDDGNVCTNDSCNPASGCVHVNNTNACNDGNACTLGEACASGVCTGGSPITAPPETAGLSAAPDRVTFTWSASLYATTYDVVSGARSGGVVDYSTSTCLSNGAGTTYSDLRADPSAGDSYWYLVRGHNACGLGTYGSVPRDAGLTACP